MSEAAYRENAMPYEVQPATEMLQEYCIYCGKELQQPHSIERGCGDECADKYGVFDRQGQIDQLLLMAALSTAPQDMGDAVRELVAEEDYEGVMKKINHLTAYHWFRNDEFATHYIGTAIDIARALGFRRVAEKLTVRYIEGGDHNGPPGGILITEYTDGRWMFKLPFIQNKALWSTTNRAIKGSGASQLPGYGPYVFPKEKWLSILNALVDALAGRLGKLPDGSTFIVPSAPVPVPGPESVAMPAPQPELATGEKIVPLPATLKRGMQVIMNDGRELIIGWVGPDRVGLWTEAEKAAWERHGGRPTYSVWCGKNELFAQKLTATEAQALENTTAVENVPQRVMQRELPESLFEFQREGAGWLDTQGAGILAFDMGLGKTATSAVVIDAPCVVVCPASLRVNWVREITHWRPDLSVSAIGLGGSKKREAEIEAALKSDVVIVNYDILKDKVLAALMARRFKTLIIDEAHYCKGFKIDWRKNKETKRWELVPWNTNSARANHVVELASTVERRFLLTGTPMDNGKHYELYALLYIVAPEAEEFKTFKKYSQRFCPPIEHGGKGKRWTEYPNQNGEELRALIHGKYLLRKTKDELDLPEKQRRTMHVALDLETAREYEQAAKDFIAWVRSMGGPEKARRAKRAEVIARLTALRRLSAIGKADAVSEQIIEHVRGGRPLVVMAHHLEAIRRLTETLDAYNKKTDRPIKYGLFTGEQSATDKQHNKDHFQDGLPLEAPIDQRDYLDVLICSITAAGVGLTLTRASDTFFLERAWKPGTCVQAEDRIHRIGQRNKAIITYYDCPGTIDVKIAKLLADKVSTIAGVIDGRALDEEDALDEVMGDMFSVDGPLTKNPEVQTGVEQLFDWVYPEEI